jgi:Arc/MetJ-type ribon-helix-helix transcriptional regulator
MCSICFANSAAASLLTLVRLRGGKRMERRPQQYERHLAKRVRSGLFESQARVWQGPAHQVQTSRICPRCESLGEFWSFSKAKHGTYQARREYIWDSLRSLLEYLKAEDRSPGVEPISEILAGGWVSPCSRSVSPQGF